MISNERKRFNREFTEQKYDDLKDSIQGHFKIEVPFRIAETPVFLPDELVKKLQAAGDEILNFITADGFDSLSRAAIPEACFVPGKEGKPLFISLDFAITEQGGEFFPQLIELQGFPSLYAYQNYLGRFYQSTFGIPTDLTWLFKGLNIDEYDSLLSKAILGRYEPQEVILLDIEPGLQKTYVDFLATRELCQISIVGLEELIIENKKLYYLDQGRKQQVKRIYNRVIFDEMIQRKDLTFAFHLTEDVEVEWAAHPNWFFRISKYLMPFIKSVFVPECHFLSDFETFPDNLEDYVLKPLFSFSGSGVEFHVNKNQLQLITDKENYVLQKKVTYAPVIEAPDSNVKTEIRLLYIWGENNSMPSLITNLCRLSRGEMIGVNYNLDKTWVGSSIAFFHNQKN